LNSLNIVTVKSPKSPVTEAYRTLRTNIQFSSFDNKIQTIVVTSSGPGEGKTTTVSNFAVTLAQSGYKTILIDCDQRKPKVHKMFNISNQTGISNILIGETSMEEAIQKTEIENLSILPSGTRPPNPAELLASTKMQKFINLLKEKYDYIILDAPPIIMVTDAQILSRYADGCLLVVASGEADRHMAAKAKELLQKVDAKILGVVLNKLDTSNKGYYGYYYHYYYGNENVKQKSRFRKFNFGKLFAKKLTGTKPKEI
jgi:capsular exopolysaccharide synthesis family protein